ncbi:MAG: tetratricopeptide repeat protein, partial [Burkholderiaceae bacterium]
MSQELAAALRNLAQQISGNRAASRADATRDFWQLARQIRSALPPLLLPDRSAPAARRIGYLFASSGRHAQHLSVLQREHAGDDVWLYYVDVAGTVPQAEWAHTQKLTGLGDVQAARIIAGAELDVLVDLDGVALCTMPLLIALHPARTVIEPMFEPPAQDPTGKSVKMPPTPPGVSQLAQSARAFADHSCNVLEQVPVAAGELDALLDGAIRNHREGDLASARATYDMILLRYPRHPLAAYLLGHLAHQQGTSVDAIPWLQRASDTAPEFRDAHYTLGQRLADLGRWREAGEAYRRAVELTPQFAAAWSGWGLAAEHDADATDKGGVEHFRRALALEPLVPQWRFNLGAALQRRGDLAGARGAYQQVLLAAPGHTEALFNLGTIAQTEGDYSAAAAAYEEVLREQPEFAAVYPQLGTCLQLLNRVDAWLENFARYRAACPESLAMAVYGLEASMAAGEAAAHEDWRDRILAGGFSAEDTQERLRNWEQLLFLLLHVDLDRATLFQWYRRYDSMASAWYGPPVRVSDVRMPGPIRIGYLSGDFRDHVMGHMVYEWVSRHDRARFSIILYSLSDTRDECTEGFEELGMPIVKLWAQPNRLAAARIQADDLDILVDCSGHTRGAEPGILALKPARVVVTHIATPGPVGLHAIDYKLTEPLAESDDAQRFVIERLFPVAHGVFPWRRYPEPDAALMPPLHVPDGSFICGVFVSLLKLSPRCLDLWRRVLDRLPRALLAFSPTNASWTPSYLRWLDAHGIESERVMFVPRSTDESGQLARYRILDVALDPMPCGNVNGTMEALEMGVPVVTLVGQRHGERLGLTLLSRFGTPETIARSE